MERNFKVRTIMDYYDLKLEKDIPKNKVMDITLERARELSEKGIIKIIKIRKCVYESK